MIVKFHCLLNKPHLEAELSWVQWQGAILAGNWNAVAVRAFQCSLDPFGERTRRRLQWTSIRIVHTQHRNTIKCSPLE